MASSTGHRQAQERLGEDIDLVVDAVAFVLTDIYRRMHFLPQEGPAGAQDRFVVLSARTESGRGEQIPGEVFLQEPVIGHVLVEGADEVVAVLPSVGDAVVGLMAAGLRIAHQVHPVARPTLAEVGGGEQLIDGVFAFGRTGLAI